MCPGPLEPGDYTSATLGVEINFTIADVGWIGGEDLPEVGFYLERPGDAPAAMFVTAFYGDVFSDPCSGEETETIGTSPQEFITFLGEREGITAQPAQEVTIGGATGLRVDVTSSLPAECTDPPWIWLWVLPEVGDFHLSDEETARFIALDVEGQTIVIVIEAFPGADYDDLLAESQPILETMTFGES